VKYVSDFKASSEVLLEWHVDWEGRGKPTFVFISWGQQATVQKAPTLRWKPAACVCSGWWSWEQASFRYWQTEVAGAWPQLYPEFECFAL